MFEHPEMRLAEDAGNGDVSGGGGGGDGGGLSESSTRNSSRNSSIYDDSGSEEFFNIDSGNNLAATITSIRTNVTRVLNMYFQNFTLNDVDQHLNQFPSTATSTNLTSSLSHEPIMALATTTTTTMPERIANALNFATKLAAATAKQAATATTTALRAQLSPTNATTAAAATLSTVGATMPASPSSSFNISTDFATPTATPTEPIITYPSFRVAIRSFDNCSALFANYTKPQQGLFCNWTWDSYLCWPPTPAGVLARMRCPAGLHGIDTRKFAARKCQLDGRWSGRPNDSYNPVGWTNYTQCYKPEVTNLLQQIKDQDVIYAIAVRTRTMEIVGLVLSLCALLLSLIIFFNFRTLRNNRTKIHKNLFIAMVIQVIIRLTLYLDQAITRGNQQTASNASVHGIDNTPYLCEASYVLLEYARTAMFMWMFIEGLYLHNVVTVKVFQGRFPHTIYSIIGWGVPVLMTAVWAVVTANKMEYSENEPCWWNYNLTIYYWILEGPRLLVMMLNFVFLLNIIRVLVVKLRQSQASDVEQARKAVRAAVVLLPLLGVTNLLYVMPPLGRPAWVFGIWAYLTYFLSSFQGFFIAMIYCFLNGEVRAALLKSITVYMSLRGHSNWVPRRASMFSGAYHTAPDTEAHAPHEIRRNDSPPNKKRTNGGKCGALVTLQTGPTTSSANAANTQLIQTRVTVAGERSSLRQQRKKNKKINSAAAASSNRTITNIVSNNNTDHIADNTTNNTSNNNNNNNNTNTNNSNNGNNSWMLNLCFRGQKNKCLMSSKKMDPQIFMTTKSSALA